MFRVSERIKKCKDTRHNANRAIDKHLLRDRPADLVLLSSAERPPFGVLHHIATVQVQFQESEVSAICVDDSMICFERLLKIEVGGLVCEEL